MRRRRCPFRRLDCSASADANESGTMTPIKHVIVIIGENRTFDHIFATYEPVGNGETIWNFCPKNRQPGRFAGSQLW